MTPGRGRVGADTAWAPSTVLETAGEPARGGLIGGVDGLVDGGLALLPRRGAGTVSSARRCSAWANSTPSIAITKSIALPCWPQPKQ